MLHVVAPGQQRQVLPQDGFVPGFLALGRATSVAVAPRLPELPVLAPLPGQQPWELPQTLAARALRTRRAAPGALALSEMRVASTRPYPV